MSRRLLVATRSLHKLREIRRILRDLPDLEVVGPDGAGIPPDPHEEELEPYDSFEENARSKAGYFRELSGLPTVADDSGLEVDLLDGRPGVRSKRFAPTDLEGEARDLANNEHLLDLLGDAPLAERTARYLCVAVLLEEGRPERVFRGVAEGLILGRPRGRGGFGYDPLFLDPESGSTFAELTDQEKNERSHRGKAFRALAEHLGSERGVGPLLPGDGGFGEGGPRSGRRADGGPAADGS